MIVTLENAAQEEGTYIVTVSFKDEDGVALTPDTLTWTLTNRLGTAINSRDAVSVTPASSYNIVLSAADLDLATPQDNTRYLLVEGTYTSDYGAGLPFKQQCVFVIEDYVHVT